MEGRRREEKRRTCKAREKQIKVARGIETLEGRRKGRKRRRKEKERAKVHGGRRWKMDKW